MKVVFEDEVAGNVNDAWYYWIAVAHIQQRQHMHTNRWQLCGDKLSVTDYNCCIVSRVLTTRSPKDRAALESLSDAFQSSLSFAGKRRVLAR